MAVIFYSLYICSLHNHLSETDYQYYFADSVRTNNVTTVRASKKSTEEIRSHTLFMNQKQLTMLDSVTVTLLQCRGSYKKHKSDKTNLIPWIINIVYNIILGVVIVVLRWLRRRAEAGSIVAVTIMPFAAAHMRQGARAAVYVAWPGIW